MIVRSHRTEMPGDCIRRRSAFTLMEILVVVAIIVLLAAIATPYFMGRFEDAKKSRALVDCKTLAETAETFKLKYGDAPQALAQLTQPGADGTAPFIEAKFLIDPWGHEYQYTPIGTHNALQKPEVWSMGPSMQNTAGVIGSWQ